MNKILVAMMMVMANVNVAQADVSQVLDIDNMTCMGEGQDDRQIGLLIEPANLRGIRGVMKITVSRMNRHEKDPKPFLTPEVRLVSEGTGLQIVNFANGYSLRLGKGDLNEIAQHATTGARQKSFYDFTGTVNFLGDVYTIECTTDLR